jgi:hypothetical protein
LLLLELKHRLAKTDNLCPSSRANRLHNCLAVPACACELGLATATCRIMDYDSVDGSPAWRSTPTGNTLGDWLCAFGWMAFVLSVVLALAMYRAHASPNGEPVAWFEGLSVWPTEVLRWLAALLSLFFIAQAYQKLVKRNQEIQSANKLADMPPVKTTSWRGWLWAEAVAAREMWFHWKPENPVLQVEWNRFREYGRTTHRWQPWRLPRRRGGRRTAASYFVRPSSAAARPFLGAGALGRIGSKRLSGQD